MGLVTLARVAGLVLMVFAVAGAAWLLTSDDFALDASRVEVSGLGYTEPAMVAAALGIDPSAPTSIFLVPTQRMERALSALPQIASAEVSALLPDRLVVTINERTPVMIVRRDDGQYRVDADGVLLARNARDAAADGLPVLDDLRSQLPTEMAVGGQLESTDLAAMLQLLALQPAALESGATALAVSVDDEDGYVITGEPFGWRAVFGQYTQTLRPPDMIARQVQCLSSLLAEGEEEIAAIYLAPLDDRCGTYRPRATPTPSPPASARM
jgi:cell division septal protein FtsQ